MIMSAVNITNVTVLDNPTAFLSPFQFEISYECLVPLEDGMVLDRKKTLDLNRGMKDPTFTVASLQVLVSMLLLVSYCCLSWINE